MVNFLEKEALFEKGLLLYESKNYVDALRVFKEDIKVHPRDFYSLSYAGLCLLKIGQLQEAVRMFLEAERCAEEDSASLKNKLQILENLDSCYYEIGRNKRTQASLSSGPERKRLFLEASASFLERELLDPRIAYLKKLIEE
jgi:tetratricopeptide (TPR) repeat protein